MATLTVGVSDRDHSWGPTGAPLTLVEYGDYQCPRCADAHEVVAAARRRLGEQLRFAFRHLPLANVHEHALAAAQAAESAAAQGAFWEMHEWLLTHQSQLDLDGLVDGARTLGLDAGRVRRDIADKVHVHRIAADVDSALRSGANGTPTFFVNGRRHDGAHDVDTLLAALQTPIDA
jgi:protein-disulfide isomerase